MARRLEAWEPTADEVQRIVAEMRPIIRDFARRSAQDCERAAAAAHSA